MIKGLAGTVLWTCVAGAVGIGLFFVKHEVKDLESRLGGLNRDIARNQEEMHVLKAEWSYLNDPARLRQLSERHLGMKPMAPNQIATLDTLPGNSDLPALAALPKAPAAAAPAIAKAEPPADDEDEDTTVAEDGPPATQAKADVSAGIKPEPRPAHPSPGNTPKAPPRPQLAAGQASRVAAASGDLIGPAPILGHGEAR